MNLHPKRSFAILSACRGCVSIHMDGVSAGWQGKWHFIEQRCSSGRLCVLVLEVRPKPFTSCLLFQIPSASESLKVNRLKRQSPTLLHSAPAESREQLKGRTVVRQQLTPYLSNHLCHVIPQAPCHRDASPDSCVVFRGPLLWSHVMWWMVHYWMKMNLFFLYVRRCLHFVCLCARQSRLLLVSSWRVWPFILI